MVTFSIGPKDKEQIPWATFGLLLGVVASYLYGVAFLRAEHEESRRAFGILRREVSDSLRRRVSAYLHTLAMDRAGVKETGNEGARRVEPRKAAPSAPAPATPAPEPAQDRTLLEVSAFARLIEEASREARVREAEFEAEAVRGGFFYRVGIARRGEGFPDVGSFFVSVFFQGSLSAFLLYLAAIGFSGTHIEKLLPAPWGSLFLVLLAGGAALVGGIVEYALKAEGSPPTIGAGSVAGGLLGFLFPFSFLQETRIRYVRVRGDVVEQSAFHLATYVLLAPLLLLFAAFRLLGGDRGAGFTGPAPLSSVALFSGSAAAALFPVLARRRRLYVPAEKLGVEEGIAQGENVRLLAYVRDPRFEQALANKGQRKYAEALDLLQVLRGDFPDLPGVNVEIAELERLRGNAEGAKVQMKKAVMQAAAKGEEKLAIEIYKRLLREFPKTIFLAEEEARIAEILEAHGFHAEASQAWRWLYECYPKDPLCLTALLKYGQICLFKFSQGKMAAEVLRTFCKHFANPGMIDGIDARAVRLLLREERSLERAIARSGQPPERKEELTALKALLCRLLLDKQFWKEARDYLEEIRGEALYQRDPQLKEMLSLCHEQGKDFEAARKVWAEVIAEWTPEQAAQEGWAKFWMAQYHVARLYIREGKAAAAFDLFEGLCRKDAGLGGRISLARFRSLLKPLAEIARAPGLAERMKAVEAGLEAAARSYSAVAASAPEGGARAP